MLGSQMEDGSELMAWLMDLEFDLARDSATSCAAS